MKMLIQHSGPAAKRKRGGQKKPETLEREQREAERARIFAEVVPCSPAELAETIALAARLKQADRDLLSSYNSPPFPPKLIYGLLAIDPDPELEGPPPSTEEFRTFKAGILERTRIAEEQIAEGQKNGAKKSAEPKLARIKVFADTNSALIKRLGAKGFSGRQLTQRVLDDWHQLQRTPLPEESKSLTRRGDNQPPPPFETLRQSWLPKAKKLLQPVGSG